MSDKQDDKPDLKIYAEPEPAPAPADQEAKPEPKPVNESAVFAPAAQVDTNAEERKFLDHVCGYHPPSTEAVAHRHVLIREATKYLGAVILKLCPNSRERSLAMTKIEEAMMWANAAVARYQ